MKTASAPSHFPAVEAAAPKRALTPAGFARLSVFVVEAGLGLSALFAGLSLMFGPDGRSFGWQPSQLGGAFSDFFWPGAVLFALIGFGSLASAAAIAFRSRHAPLVTQLASLSLVAFIGIEVGTFTPTHPLQLAGLLLALFASMAAASGLLDVTARSPS